MVRGGRRNVWLLASVSAERVALSPAAPLLGRRAGAGSVADLRGPRPACAVVHRVHQGIRESHPAGLATASRGERVLPLRTQSHLRRFLAILVGEVLLFGSSGLLEYTAVAWCVGAAAVRWYEEPVLARKFGAEYQAYRRAVHAWLPQLHPWTPADQTTPAEGH